MELHRVRHREQTFVYSDFSVRLPAEATREMLDILSKWQTLYPREETLIQQRHGVPSLFVRFDCVIAPDGALHMYEIQDGCAWIGYTGVANTEFRRVRDEIVATEWPGLAAIISPQDPNTDDELWLPRRKMLEALREDGPLIVRSRLSLRTPEERERLIARSVKPVLAHNDKTYGEHFGWWKRVTWEETGRSKELPWENAFVLKPIEGHGSTDIMIWKPGDRTGRATRTQIVNTLERNQEMLLQPYHPPMQTMINGAAYNMIYRPYFIYSGERGWIPAHGLWTARPSPALRIHGASDAISGPLMMD
ncbi:MAG: hypothetical protein WA021_00840 [Minisyncoccia bacterium]